MDKEDKPNYRWVIMVVIALALILGAFWANQDTSDTGGTSVCHITGQNGC